MNDVSLYVHIPFCKSKCSYCDFFSLPQPSINDTYVERLIVEHDYRKNKHEIGAWNTVYFGGGTPSLLKTEQIIHLFQHIKPYCTENAEITFECNPDDISCELLTCLKKVGVNRISIGIQSFCNSKLLLSKRRSTSEINHSALSLIQSYNFNHFSADLIAGLPPQDKDSKILIHDIETLLQYSVDHVSLYSLTLEKGTMLYDQWKKNPQLIDEQLIDEQWILGRDYLQSNGFLQYEVSNFSKPDAQSSHNCCYWNMNSYVGLGAGATGTMIKNNNAIRYTNSTCIESYCSLDFSHQEEQILLSSEECISEYLMMGFRKTQGIHPSVFYERFGFSIKDRIEPIFSQWKEKGLAIVTKDGNYSLNAQGLLFLNSFLMLIL